MKRKHIWIYGILLCIFMSGVFELSVMTFGIVPVFAVCTAIVVIVGIGLPLYRIMR